MYLAIQTISSTYIVLHSHSRGLLSLLPPGNTQASSLGHISISWKESSKDHWDKMMF